MMATRFAQRRVMVLHSWFSSARTSAGEVRPSPLRRCALARALACHLGCYVFESARGLAHLADRREIGGCKPWLMVQSGPQGCSSSSVSFSRGRKRHGLHADRGATAGRYAVQHRWTPQDFCVCRKRKDFLVGGVKELIRLLEDVVSLKANQPGVSPEFFGFASWAEVLQFVQEEEGEALRMFVQLVERFGERHLLWAMRRVAGNENGADVVISTAHKAKGREWDSVRLSTDFASSRPDRATVVDAAECRLFYVAMTRAKRHLDVAPETLALFASGPSADSQKPMRPRPTIHSVPQGGLSESAASPVHVVRPTPPPIPRPQSWTTPVAYSFAQRRGSPVAWIALPVEP